MHSTKNGLPFPVTPAVQADLEELTALYDRVNDTLAAGTNYPGWVRGVYPNRETAEDGLREGTLFAARQGGVIAGTVILNHDVPPAYEGGSWSLPAEPEEVLVVHTLAVHPSFRNSGAARAMLGFAREYALQRKIKSIRLDTFESNAPAISLYLSCGYRYAGTVDLGLNIPGLKWFQLYERNLFPA